MGPPVHSPYLSFLKAYIVWPKVCSANLTNYKASLSNNHIEEETTPFCII